MSFNLITHFRKYQRVWMASVLFICMITFVLCTGLGQGGLEDRVLGWFRSWRGGKTVALVDGRSVGIDALYELKERREVANDFMRAALKITARNVEEGLKEAKGQLEKSDKADAQSKERKELGAHVQALQLILDYLQKQLVDRPRYFETGTKLDDLLDFMLWRDEADKLGVVLVEKNVKDLIETKVIGVLEGVNRDFQQNKISPINPLHFWNARAALETMNKVNENHRTADYTVALAALQDEFRVQIAQFSILATHGVGRNFATDEKSLGWQIRFPLTPHQMWKGYEQNLTKFDVVMLPVSVEHFINDKRIAKPSQAELEELFNKYKNTPYNPASDVPGFVQPEKVKISYLTANPGAPYYRDVAALQLALQDNWPGFVDTGMGALGTAVGQLAHKPARDYVLEKSYLKDQERYKHGALDDFPFEQAPLSSNNFELPLYTAQKPTPEMVAGLVGTLVSPGSLAGGLAEGMLNYQAGAYLKYKEAMAPVAQQEAEKRAQIAATLVLSGTGATTPLPVLNMFLDGYTGFENQYSFLPYAVAEPYYRAKEEKKLAGDYAKRIMDEAQKYLAAAKGAKGREFNARLDKLMEQYGGGLELHKSETWANRFDVGDVAKHPQLAKFKQAFDNKLVLDNFNRIEGRAGTENRLTEDDFYRLFFDPSESFSVGGGSPYMMQQWPPQAIAKSDLKLEQFGSIGDHPKNVRFNMWVISDNRFLFWKTDAQEAKPPASLDKVRDEVVHAWKFLQARKLAFDEAYRVAYKDKDEAKKNAPSLFKTYQTQKADYLPFLNEQAKDLDTKVVTLSEKSTKEKIAVALAGPITRQGWNYEPSKLPKGLIPYPGPNMNHSIFSLFDLKGPVTYVETAKKDAKEPAINDELVTALDKLNQDLFQKGELRQIQVLTNKPRSVYYVAAVNKVYPLTEDEFLAAFAKAGGISMTPDFFFEIYRSEKAMEFRTLFIEKLREKRLKIEDASAFQS